MKGLDTNVLVRLVTADDPVQVGRAQRFLRQHRRHGPFWVDWIVLCELVWTLRTTFGFDRDQIASVLTRLLSSAEVTVEGHPVVRDALYLFRTSRADFADCLIGLSNGLSGCERTVTFDRRAAELDEFELI